MILPNLIRMLSFKKKKRKQAAFANPVMNALLYISLTICYEQVMTKHKSSYFQTVLLKRLLFLGRARDFFFLCLLDRASS